MPKIDSYSQLVKEKNDDVESIDSFDLMSVLKEKGNVTFNDVFSNKEMTTCGMTNSRYYHTTSS